MSADVWVNRRAVLGLGIGLAGIGAHAQAWPDRPLRLLVPAGPGSVPDVRARWLAERLGTSLGQPLVVENRPGAGGVLAMEAASRSPADGHTWVLVHAGLMVFNPMLYVRPGYDVDDFQLLTRVGVGPLLLLVPPNSPFPSMADLLARGREAGASLNFASQGIGTPPHLAAELLMQTAGMRSVHVPYTVPTQPIADLLGGRVDWMLEGLPVALPLVRSGRLRALAVTSRARLPALPDVPTMPELGLAGVVLDGWTGLALRRGTPGPVVDRIYRQVSQVLADDGAHQWFRAVGNLPGGETPQEAQALMRDEWQRWGRVIEAAGLSGAR